MYQGKILSKSRFEIDDNTHKHTNQVSNHATNKRSHVQHAKTSIRT